MGEQMAKQQRGIRQPAREGKAFHHTKGERFVDDKLLKGL